MILIHKPIWRADTGRREVGLAVHKILQEGAIVQVEIDYVRKDGTRIYPNIFEISKVKLSGYPEKVVHGTRIMLIPINDFKERIVR
jgi:hypothetical protein